MIFAPANNCMIMEPVTIGPIPKCMMVPEAPAIIERKPLNKSNACPERPQSMTLVIAKQMMRTNVVVHIFSLKRTCRSGLVMVGQTSTKRRRAQRRLLSSPLHMKQTRIAAAPNPSRQMPTRKNPTPSSQPPQADGRTYHAARPSIASQPSNLPYRPTTGIVLRPSGMSIMRQAIK